MPKLFTIGHSNKKVGELIDKLKANGIDILVDVRSRPYSRFNPQFNREFLKLDLQNAGIEYIWRGANLGGLDQNVNWDEAIDELIRLTDENSRFSHRVCVMCSESEPSKCHRHSTIEPAFIAKGGTIHHILWKEVANAIMEETVKPDNLVALF